MKKLLLCVLCAVILVSALTSCDFGAGADSVVTVQELSITLPSDLKNVYSGSQPVSEVYRSDDYEVNIDRVDKSTIVPNEGYDFPTLEELMSTYLLIFLTNNPDAKVSLTRDGDLLYMDADTGGNGIPDTLFSVYESEKAFWIVRIEPLTEDYATVRDQCLAWAKTVTFTETN